MGKYPIKREFFPFSYFVSPVQTPKVAGWLGSMMRAPGWLFRDREVAVRREMIEGYEGASIEVLVMEPYGLTVPAPCLVYYHGGGFFFGAAGYHYKLARRYALEGGCKVVFVQYRLAPKHPHPIPSEDCYAGLQWVFEHAQQLSIDPARVAVAGDSAGGALAAAVCQMARDRGSSLPCAQLLIYPVTDRRMDYPSCRAYTDTPMWNARLSKKMWQGYVQDPAAPHMAYASPMEADTFEGLPPAYVETAEFDCLHDEGVAYALALQGAGVAVTLSETEGTMHGFDIVTKAPTTQAAIATRLAYLNKVFYEG